MDKAIVVHDYFAIKGGGERVALELAALLNARLAFAYATQESYAADMFPPGVLDLNLNPLLRAPGLKPLALAARFTLLRPALGAYRTRVFSGASAPFAAPRPREGERNILYCHTPPRFLYDQREAMLARLPLPVRQAAALVLPAFAAAYEAAVQRMTLVVANSRNVQDRVRRYLGRESVVVHPPCDVSSFGWDEARGYYLSTARLSPLKRVGTIVEAFLRMPDKKLIVCSGGDEESKLRERAAGAPNITFTGWIGEAELRSLLAGAIATIYVPVDEDFGISPVESMAAGKPVIGVAEGGLLETLVDGETGLLLPRVDADAIEAAVRSLDATRAARMRAACRQQAMRFDRGRFVKEIRDVIGQL